MRARSKQFATWVSKERMLGGMPPLNLLTMDGFLDPTAVARHGSDYDDWITSRLAGKPKDLSGYGIKLTMAGTILSALGTPPLSWLVPS